MEKYRVANTQNLIDKSPPLNQLNHLPCHLPTTAPLSPPCHPDDIIHPNDEPKEPQINGGTPKVTENCRKTTSQKVTG
jgi:hypothetical protein